MGERKYNRVGVLMGGPSAEREVSLASGQAVARGLLSAGYDVVEIDVSSRDLELPPDLDAAFIALHGEFGEDGSVQALLDEKGIDERRGVKTGFLNHFAKSAGPSQPSQPFCGIGHGDLRIASSCLSFFSPCLRRDPRSPSRGPGSWKGKP